MGVRRGVTRVTEVTDPAGQEVLPDTRRVIETRSPRDEEVTLRPSPGDSVPTPRSNLTTPLFVVNTTYGSP